MNSQDIFVHHARCSALSANLSGPDLIEPVPPQGSIALPSIGGSSASRAGKFDHPFITFESAQSEVFGEMVSRDPKVYVTRAQTTVKGLNIQDVILAESITARVVATTTMGDMTGLGPKPALSFSGTSFQGLVIDGKSYSLKSSEHFDSVMARMRELYARSQSGVRLATTFSADPMVLHPRASTLNRELAATEGVIEEENIQRSEIQAIRVPGFGDICIAEMLYNPYICQIHMLRVEVNGGGFIGDLTAGAVEGGASCYPGHKT